MPHHSLGKLDAWSVGGPGDEGECDLDVRFERDALPMIDRLFTGALRLIRSREDAEDLVQETMLRAYASFDSFHGGASLKSWLFRILQNAWYGRYRDQQCRRIEARVEYIGRLPRSASSRSLHHLG